MSKSIPGNQKHLTFEDRQYIEDTLNQRTSFKYNYNARTAQREYEELLEGARSGINLTRSELHRIDSVAAPLIAQGQSPYMIVTNHPELGLSVKTLYNYIDQGILLSRNIDLKR